VAAALLLAPEEEPNGIGVRCFSKKVALKGAASVAPKSRL